MRRRGRPPLRAAWALVLTPALVVGACGPVPPVSLSTPGSTAAAPSGSTGPAAQPTRWPSGTVTAVVALGSADRDITTFLATYQAAVSAGDLKAMWGAADGFVTTAKSLLPSIARLDEFGPTKGLAAKYRASIPPATQAAMDVRDAITAGEGPKVQEASLRLIAALKVYADLRGELAEWVAQSASQQKLLLQ